VARLAALGQGGYRLLTDDWERSTSRLAEHWSSRASPGGRSRSCSCAAMWRCFCGTAAMATREVRLELPDRRSGRAAQGDQRNAKEEAIHSPVDRLAELATASEGWRRGRWEREAVEVGLHGIARGQGSRVSSLAPTVLARDVEASSERRRMERPPRTSTARPCEDASWSATR